MLGLGFPSPHLMASKRETEDLFFFGDLLVTLDTTWLAHAVVCLFRCKLGTLMMAIFPLVLLVLADTALERERMDILLKKILLF